MLRFIETTKVDGTMLLIWVKEVERNKEWVLHSSVADENKGISDAIGIDVNIYINYLLDRYDTVIREDRRGMPKKMIIFNKKEDAFDAFDFVCEELKKKNERTAKSNIILFHKQED